MLSYYCQNISEPLLKQFYKITTVYYFGDGMVVINEFVRSTDNKDVIDCRRQFSVTCVVHVEIQRPQNTQLAGLTSCTQITAMLLTYEEEKAILFVYTIASFHHSKLCHFLTVKM